MPARPEVVVVHRTMRNDDSVTVHHERNLSGCCVHDEPRVARPDVARRRVAAMTGPDSVAYLTYRCAQPGEMFTLMDRVQFVVPSNCIGSTRSGERMNACRRGALRGSGCLLGVV